MKGAEEDAELAALKDELRHKLPEQNVCKFSASDLARLCADVEAKLSAVILAEAGRFTSRDALDLEIKAHEDFALNRVRHFTGRQSVLDVISRHIRGGESRPLVVHGASGCGKSAIMAKAAELAKKPGAVLIQRFIGVTPDSSSGVSLLSSLCRQLSRDYGVTEETPIGFQPLVASLHERMARATAEKPLVIFLDALDQLRADDEARSFTWLKQNLPDHVSIIVSTTEIPAGLTSAAEVEVKEFPADEADEVFTAWLADAKRKLKEEQRRKVLGSFAQSGLPLYLKLAFEEARRWRSFDAADKCVIGNDVSGMIDVLFNRLSEQANHGPVLVERSLGYLAAARYGLTEDEMLDVLTADDVVWGDFDKKKHHEVSERRLPVVVWSRLSLDLEPYLTERAAPGGTVIAFYHRQLAERVEAKFLAGDEAQKRHGDLAGYFYARPPWLDEGRKAPNARRAAELVFQQRSAREWSEAEAILFDCPFLFAKVAAGMVLDLEDEYRVLLKDAPESELHRRDDLQLIHGALRLSLHIVAKDSGQCASQMRGRLLAHQAKPGIVAFLEELDTCTPRPRLRPLRPALQAAGGPMLRILEGHTGWVRAVALSADGKRAVSGSWDDTVRVWDLEGNQPPRVLEGHRNAVEAVAISADGKRAISGSRDSTLRVWDLEGNQLPRVLKGHTGSVNAVALSADGRRAVSGSHDATVRVWDLEGDEPPRVLEGHTSGINAVALSADGKRAVSASLEAGLRVCVLTLRVWDLEVNQPPRILQGYTASVNAIALSADGKRAVSCSSAHPGCRDSSLQIWDLESNQPPHVLECHTEWLNDVALSADGKRVVAGSGVVLNPEDNSVRIWDLEGNQPSRVLEGHTGMVSAMAISADGKRAISGSEDKTVRVWDLEANQPPRTLEGRTKGVIGVALSADGKRALLGSYNHTAYVWDLEGNQPPRLLEGYTVKVWAVALSVDGKRAVSGWDDNTVRIWDLEGNQPPRILGSHTDWVRAVALSADGKRAVSGSQDETVRVWDLKGSEPPRILEGHTGWVAAVAISDDGKRAVSGSSDSYHDSDHYVDYSVGVWDLEGDLRSRLLEGHTNTVNDVAISSDGQYAVSGSSDKTLRIWDLKGDQPPRILEGHTDTVTAVALSGDGKRAVSSSDDKTLRVWDLESGECLVVFTCNANVLSCAWGGNRIVAGDGLGNVHLFAWEE